MKSAATRMFPKAALVIDRFHVQQLAFDAVQELRIHYRWEALEAESMAIEMCKVNKYPYEPTLLRNADSLKQLLTRSRHLLFKQKSKWAPSQQQRAELLFELYPDLENAYDLARGLGDIYNSGKDKMVAFKKLALWFNAVEDSGIGSLPHGEPIGPESLPGDSELLYQPEYKRSS